MPEEMVFLDELNAELTRENWRDAREMIAYSLSILESGDMDGYEYDLD